MKPSDFDAETLQIIYGYAGRDLFEPKMLSESVFWSDDDEEWSLAEFGDLLSDLADRIPEEYRASAIVRFRPGEYDESRGSFSVVYTRPETPEEIADRVQRALRYAREQQAGERAQFERLKQKFAAEL